MRRRDFIAAIGNAAAWPLAARAQNDWVRRIEMLIDLPDDDSERIILLRAFRQRLEELGRREGRDIHIVIHYPGDFSFASPQEQYLLTAKEIVRLGPDVIFAQAAPGIAALAEETRTIPIVFVQVSDPIGSGFAESFAKPGGNITGFTDVEARSTGKWLQMLKEIAPQLERVAMIANPHMTPYAYLFEAASIAAAALGLELVPIAVERAGDIERELSAIAQMANSGLMLLPDQTGNQYRNLYIDLAARNRLPAVYPDRFFVAAGGLMSYGIDRTEMFRQGASYVDRILRGERPANLPIQAPVKYETVLNLKAAKALGLRAPSILLAAADEVIE
jgi:putative tryptophan/tyrosine transport system substrate-binding protein